MRNAEEMRYKLLTWVCAHRAGKDDKYLGEIEATSIDLKNDFTLVRDALYHYSVTALKSLIQQPLHAYFVHIALTQGRDRIIESQLNKGNEI